MVHIDYRNSETKPVRSSYRIDVDPGSGLTRREMAILFNSAKMCHVHKILAGETTFDWHLVPCEERRQAVG